MADGSSFFDNLKLPSANPQEALETVSRNYFKPLFDPARFEVRSEDYRDKGVDFDIEIIKDTGERKVYTNFRFIVQLKSTDTINVNTDGSISIQIETSNINYLLNHPMPAYYVLYHNPSGNFYFENLRDYTSSLAAKDENWKDQASHTLRFSRGLDNPAIDDIHSFTLQKGIMQRQLDEQTSLLAHSQHANDKIILDRDLNIISDAEIRKLVEKGGFALINKNRWADVIKLHRKSSGSMETSGLYNLVLGVASYHSGNMPDALSFLKAAKKKDASLQPELENVLNYFEAMTKYALGILGEKEYNEKMVSCSNSPTLAFYISLENTKNEYFRNCNLDNAFKIYEQRVRKIILDEKCPTGLKFSATLELLQIDGENINMEYVRNISRFNGLGLENMDMLYKAHHFLTWFHNAYQEWLSKIDEIMVFCTEDLKNGFLYQLASITKVRMNYHLLVISREVFLLDENPMLPQLEFKEGDSPFRDLLDQAAKAADYFRGISHIENLMVCLSLEYEMAHYINDATVYVPAMEQMEANVERYELNTLNAVLKRIKSEGAYHQTFLRMFDFEGHAQQKQVHLQRLELKAMDREEAADTDKDVTGLSIILLYPIGYFSFPQEKRETVYEILQISQEARPVFDYMFDNGIQAVANINYAPITAEGYIDRAPKAQTPEMWTNLYTVRKRFYQEKFYRINC